MAHEIILAAGNGSRFFCLNAKIISKMKKEKFELKCSYDGGLSEDNATAMLVCYLEDGLTDSQLRRCINEFMTNRRVVKKQILSLYYYEKGSQL